MPAPGRERLYPVWEQIERNLHGRLGLNQLAFISNFSPFHFHRFFRKHQGESPQSYIKRLRIEKAAYELKMTDFPILEIALEAGYDSNEAFTRAFRRYLGKTPSQYRAQMQKRTARGPGKKTALAPPPDLTGALDPVEFRIRNTPPLRLVYARHVGPYAKLPGPLPDSPEVQRLLAYVQFINSAPENHKWIGISHDDPDATPPEKIRFDLGVTVGADSAAAPGLGVQELPGGKHLQARYRGDYSGLPRVYDWLLNEYAPEQNMRVRNAPPFELYLRPFESAGRAMQITDIYIPVR